MINPDNLSKKAVRILKKDQEVKREYSNDWTKWTTASFLVAVVFTVIIFFEKSNSSVWIISYLWGVVLEIVTSFVLLFAHFRDRDSELYVLSDGSFPKGCCIRKVIYYTCSFVPLYLCIWLRFGVVWYKALYFTPIALVIIIVLGLIYGVPSSGYSSGSSLSVSDMIILKQDMIMAGIDPNKFPAAAITCNVKEMSISDWSRIRMDMELAGFDVSLKKNRKKV